MIHANLATVLFIFFLTALISSSPPALYCPPAAPTLVDGGSTSMSCAAEIDEAKKKKKGRLIGGVGGLERWKRSRHFQAALLLVGRSIHLHLSTYGGEYDTKPPRSLCPLVGKGQTM